MCVCVCVCVYSCVSLGCVFMCMHLSTFFFKFSPSQEKANSIHFQSD